MGRWLGGRYLFRVTRSSVLVYAECPRNSNTIIKVAAKSEVQINLCILHLTVSTVVGNKLPQRQCPQKQLRRSTQSNKTSRYDSLTPPPCSRSSWVLNALSESSLDLQRRCQVIKHSNVDLQETDFETIGRVTRNENAPCGCKGGCVSVRAGLLHHAPPAAKRLSMQAVHAL